MIFAFLTRDSERLSCLTKRLNGHKHSRFPKPPPADGCWLIYGRVCVCVCRCRFIRAMITSRVKASPRGIHAALFCWQFAAVVSNWRWASFPFNSNWSGTSIRWHLHHEFHQRSSLAVPLKWQWFGPALVTPCVWRWNNSTMFFIY